ncbi:fimbrial protein [Proteus columbae]|uniref:fimbrial protein n=1 Tax=Proteus columbae TaxID=1987580 RepID=UPI0018C849D3|nr:fimbrial protein [Proteus columbae]MBG6027615.1 type 1 fimbrial protein [Proteus mirabilis]MBG6048469.1 type 1 fimbrial protein [Proteus mirabilis]
MTISTKKLLPIALLVSAITASTGVLAAETQTGTLSFKGLIYSSSCIIDINDTNSPNANILMGRYPTSAFSGKDSEVGGENGNGKIEITLENCPPVGKVTLKLDGKADSSSDQTLALDNPTDSKTAQNVGIRIYDVKNPSTPLVINGSKSETIDVAGADSSWTAEFVAKYVSTASTVTAGQADATLNYTITYQ